MTKVYLIHGWGGSPKSEPWFEWLEQELKKRGIKFEAFDMPDTDNPKIEAWVNYLRENIKEIEEDSYFVGHSIGCQTIMRFLEKMPKSEKIKGCVFVAGWFDLINLEEEELEIAHPWINNKIDFDRVKKHTTNFLAIFSDNDPDISLNEVKKFEERLGAKIIIKKREKHFNDTKEIPEILRFIK